MPQRGVLKRDHAWGDGGGGGGSGSGSGSAKMMERRVLGERAALHPTPHARRPRHPNTPSHSHTHPQSTLTTSFKALESQEIGKEEERQGKVRKENRNFLNHFTS